MKSTDIGDHLSLQHQQAKVFIYSVKDSSIYQVNLHKDGTDIHGFQTVYPNDLITYPLTFPLAPPQGLNL